MLDVHKQTSSGNLRIEPFSNGLWDCPALTSFLSECKGPCIGHSPSCFSLQMSHPVKVTYYSSEVYSLFYYTTCCAGAEVECRKIKLTRCTYLCFLDYEPCSSFHLTRKKKQRRGENDYVHPGILD